ncbi:GNAT family N-acetyltransferase [Streptomyces antarcticus]|uniref:GNAT family N-acetyltransferase n=1 Tax=Streptomyces antarcticus TaxID=2996458 RepID=UPI00226E5EB4|nr:MULTISPECIES: GNAT family N-acetyltransferase [unclassified Streptomyces]MCY0942368.1 GNAT family N-acetyltransferase [Streptomyces sp. H34-AA3]MCZ4080635.1 GNAT family N-acetyltransferase [Streptomyces sp. H34-S5]
MHQLLSTPAGARIRFRRGSLADWPLIDTFHQACSAQALHRRWGRTRILRRDIERLLHHSASWIALHATNEVVALASAGPLGREAGVFDLGLQVADDHQRRGVGLALAQHAAAHARSQGGHTLSAYTEASNWPLRTLVRRLGHPTEIREGAHLDIRIPLTSAGADGPIEPAPPPFSGGDPRAAE